MAGKATYEQVAELAQVVANQLQAIADDKVDITDVRAKIALIKYNVNTLEAWTDVNSDGSQWWT